MARFTANLDCCKEFNKEILSNVAKRPLLLSFQALLGKLPYPAK